MALPFSEMKASTEASGLGAEPRTAWNAYDVSQRSLGGTALRNLNFATDQMLRSWEHANVKGDAQKAQPFYTE